MSLRTGIFRFFVFALTVAAALPAFAQSASIVTGVVRDSSGGAIPGATVRIVNDVTGTSRETLSTEQGVYRLEPLTAGRYRVDATLSGFEAPSQTFTLAAGQSLTLDITLSPSRVTEAVVVTARRIEETAQEVPIPVSVVSGNQIADAGAFNVNRLKEQIPTVQFYSTNPRNSSVQIRGLGAPFGLTNDGIEPGVGMYIDGVFYARPASASLDFLDVERVEVLRGPQGTLFGKNTTAGAINVITRRPGFTRETEFELNYGSIGFVQAKGSISGPLLGRKVAGRLSFSGTQRDGTVYNVNTQAPVNNLNNLGVRGQVLFTPSDSVALTLAIDNTRQRVTGSTQVFAGVTPTLRPANRQFDTIAAEVGYEPPTRNAFDRITDVDSPLQSNQGLGGASLNADWRVGSGRLTSTTSWRYWDWDPLNDRDFIGLPITTVSSGTSKQRQWTQEVRYAGDLTSRANFVAGAFVYQQQIKSDPVIKQEQGASAARWLVAPTPAAATPGLLEGYGFNQYLDYQNTSAALFGQLEWSVTDRLRLLPGVRFNYDKKDVDFDQQVYGGLQTTDPALIALKLSVLAPQQYTADVDDTNLSGQITLAYALAPRVNSYATYATSFKSVGLNLGGVPTDALGRPVLSAATVRPEDVRHIEAGFKTQPIDGVTANVTVYDTAIKDFQTQVQNAAVGVLRGYLANAEKVRVRGVEFDGNARVNDHLSFYGAAAYTDGRYISFPDAPAPLEETGGPGFKDISGSVLPGISEWAGSLGGEYANPGKALGRAGEYFGAIDASYRSSFSSSPSASKYLVVQGYSLLNARVGFRAANGWTLSLWARNLLDKEYFDLLSPVAGGTGLYVGQPGDERTVGVTLRVTLR